MQNSRKPKFAIRTVKNGRVKIDGKFYIPSDCHREYKGELEGWRLAFGLYYVGKERELFISLICTEKQFRSVDFLNDQPNCIDGYFYWEWWKNES